MLAFACKQEAPGGMGLELADVESGYSMLALVGIIDPPREEAIQAVAECHRAGIQVKMITGDHAETAKAIGALLDIGVGKPAITGAELALMDDAALRRMPGERAAAPLSEELGLDDYICTRFEVDAGGCLTGELVRPLCYGAGKVTLAQRWADERGLSLDHAYFYTDSYTDLPMLQRVGRPVVVNPDPRLKRHARRHGIPTLSILR